MERGRAGLRRQRVLWGQRSLLVILVVAVHGVEEANGIVVPSAPQPIHTSAPTPAFTKIGHGPASQVQTLNPTILEPLTTNPEAYLPLNLIPGP